MKIIKPKFWDLQKPNFISYFLLPFTLLIRLNNFLKNFTPKIQSKDLKTICIGNIYIGGTGKTPSVIKLYEILKKNGFDNIATGKKMYSSQKDEQILLDKQTSLITEKSRSKILSTAIKDKKRILIFDDGLQDKYINYDCKIVCFNSDNLIGNGLLIPAGPLREKMTSLKNYDVVFLKNINSINYKVIDFIKTFNPKIKIFNSRYEIQNINDFNLKKDYLIFSGIGTPNNFKEILIKNNFNIKSEIIFPDHHNYKKNDILMIKKKAKEFNSNVITTEKDFVKIPEEFSNEIKFLRVKIKFDDESDLINYIKSKIYE